MAVERAPQVRRFASPANGAKRGVRLEWEGKKAEIDVPVLPFQTIETINEPRQQLTLFSPPDDTRLILDKAWKNKLIWGDNKLAMAALGEQYAGQIDLIYIDPPFDTGADFSIEIEVGDESVTKQPSIIERHAYQDTWGRGIDSYLQMMYDRLLLMRDLLSESGSIYIHCDWRTNSTLRLLLDEVFGGENYRNEVSWVKNSLGAKGRAQQYPRNRDSILFYTKSEQYRFNRQYTEQAEVIEVVDGKERHSYKIDSEGRYYWTSPKGDYTDASIEKLRAEGRIEETSSGTTRIKYFVERRGSKIIKERIVDDVWGDIEMIFRSKDMDWGYDTQKPEALLERVLRTSSNPGDLVLDCFVGSGTTVAVAERLDRRWIACDLGRFAIHTTRKRLLGWKGASGERCRAFEILNVGHYEQQFWQGVEGEDVDDITAKKREQNYVRTMLAFYHARTLDGSTRVHGEKGGRGVHIGPLAESVSRIEAHEASEAALDLGFRGLDILGWEWDFESNETVKEDAKMRGVDLRLIQIPEEMLDGRARKLFQDGKLTFPELASLKVTVESVPGQSRTYRVHLDDFIIPPATLPEALRDRVTRWQDYIDYWSVDWEYGTEPPPFERTFRNMWQDFRTRKKRTLTITSENHAYTASGTYTVMVKVVDIFGNDTTVSREVVVP
jgi:adenine-specific DNA-methyltransferase